MLQHQSLKMNAPQNARVVLEKNWGFTLKPLILSGLGRLIWYRIEMPPLCSRLWSVFLFQLKCFLDVIGICTPGVSAIDFGCLYSWFNCRETAHWLF